MTSRENVSQTKSCFVTAEQQKLKEAHHERSN